MAETTVEKVQSRMEASVFPVTSESEQPGAFCPRAKDWHEFSYAKSLTRIQAQMRRSSWWDWRGPGKVAQHARAEALSAASTGGP